MPRSKRSGTTASRVPAPTTSKGKGKGKAVKHDLPTDNTTLNCLIEGDNIFQGFEVTVAGSESIYFLKELVYQIAFDRTVHTFPPEYLLLIKVTTSQSARIQHKHRGSLSNAFFQIETDIDLTGDVDLRQLTIDQTEVDVRGLNALDFVSEIWPAQPHPKMLHIFVIPPTRKKIPFISVY